MTKLPFFLFFSILCTVWSLAYVCFVLIAYLEAETADEKKGVVCSPGMERTSDEPCRVNTSALTQDCNIANNFGYGKEKQPCVLLRLNKVVCFLV